MANITSSDDGELLLISDIEGCMSEYTFNLTKEGHDDDTDPIYKGYHEQKVEEKKRRKNKKNN